MIQVAVAKDGRSFRELAEAIGTSYDVLNNLANGRTSPKTHLELIERLRGELKQSQGWPWIVEADVLPVVDLPLVGTDRSVTVPIRLKASDHVAFEVDGDSMMPFLQPGDIAVAQSEASFRPNRIFLIRCERRQCRECTSGYCLRQVEHDGEAWVFRPINPAYAPVRANASPVGRLVALYRTEGTREIIVRDPAGLTPPTKF